MLIADDSAVLRELVSLVLEHDGQEVVGAVESGEEAVELARTEQPDAVVMDLRMPGIGGLAATVAVRELLPDCLIVVVSASGDADDRAEAIAAGASAFLVKEDLAELRQMLRDR